MIKDSEREFFELIKYTCQIIFDIGCREDIHYIEDSEGKEFYLFEPNFNSFNNCKKNINKFIKEYGTNLNKIHLYNFGLGNISKTVDYYLDTQSLFKRHPYPKVGFKPCAVIIKKFSEFLKENNIEFIGKNNINLNKISLYNFGIGNISKTVDYYMDTQSVFKRHPYPKVGFKPCVVIIKKFSEFLKENNIEFIDFLKIDTEGCEPDILLDDIEFIKTRVKYIQFEWASTWFHRDDGITFVDIFNEYINNFNFYFLYDEDHPLSNKYKKTLSPIINQEDYEELNENIYANYGLDIVMIKRKG